MPYVFTEHGALQAANILKSEKAKEMSIYVVRDFVQMLKELAISQEVLRQLAQIDKKLLASRKLKASESNKINFKDGSMH